MLATKVSTTVDDDHPSLSTTASVSVAHEVDCFARAMSILVEIKDPYTAVHQRRVGRLAELMATDMKLPRERCYEIRLAGFVHDIGKLAIPHEILSKPGKLSRLEIEFVQTHTTIGHQILSELHHSPVLALVALQHHEREDGSGYPNRISGEDITLEARIIGVADVLEAMASSRPYRASLGIEAALNEITQNGKVRYFAPAVDSVITLLKSHEFDLDALVADEV